MKVVHLSDLHLSRYGESNIWTRRERDDARGWVTLHTWHRWDVEGCRDRKGRPDRLRLVDPAGVVHRERSWPSRKEDKAISALLAQAMEQHRTSAERLVRNPPPPEDLDALLRITGRNTNLRFVKLMQQVEAIGPDAVLITGDLTDNGFGYDLVRHYLDPWVRARRLFTVPGNHDTYDMFPVGGRRRRAEQKENNYNKFAVDIGMAADENGIYLRYLGDIAVVGIDSCEMPRTPLSASGEVPRAQLKAIRALGDDPAFAGAALRIGLIHHHLLSIPFRVGRRSPVEMGIRLRNAEETMEAVTGAGFDIIFNGHRHHGYVVKLPGRPLVVSSPSSTLGCKSQDSGKAYAWVIDLQWQQPFPMMHPLPYDSAPSWKDGI